VELFIETELVAATQHGFHQQFQRCDAVKSQYSAIVGIEMASRRISEGQ
jgi:hypothetical protein